METATLVIASASLVVSCLTLTAVLFIAHEAKGEIDNTKSSASKAFGSLKAAFNQIEL
jgi:hypothetical protein